MHKKFVSLLIASVLLSVLVTLPADRISQASHTLPNTPATVLNSYFAASQAGNVDLMMDLAKDTRFEDTKDQKAYYKQALKENQLIDYRVVGEEFLNDNHMKFSVVLNYKKSSPLTAIPVEVVKENDQWKVLLVQGDVGMHSSLFDDVGVSTLSIGTYDL